MNTKIIIFSLIGEIISMGLKTSLIESDGAYTNNFDIQSLTVTQNIKVEFANNKNHLFDGEFCDVTIGANKFYITVNEDGDIRVVFDNEKLLNQTASFTGESVDDIVNRMYIFIDALIN